MRFVGVLARMRFGCGIRLGVGLGLGDGLLLGGRVLVEDVVAVHLCAELDVDGRERVGLDEPGHSQLRHLEQGEERDHEVELRREIGEELLELEAASHAKHVHQLVDPIGQRDAFVHHVVRELDLALGEDTLEGFDEREERNLRQRRQAGVHGLLEGRAAEEDVPAHDAARLEIGACLLVLLVLEQAANERLAWVFLVLGERVVLLAGRGGRQQHLRLDVREGRGHDEVFARQVEVEQRHHGEVLEVLLRHEADRDVEDVELVLLAEVQKEIERPLERGQGYGVTSRPGRIFFVGLGRRHDRPRLEDPRRGFKGHRPSL